MYKVSTPHLEVHYNPQFPVSAAQLEFTFSAVVLLEVLGDVQPGESNLLQARRHPWGTSILKRKLVSSNES